MRPELMLLVGLVAIFVAVVLIAVTVSALTSQRAQVSRSLAAVRAIRAVPDARRRAVDRPFGERVITPMMDRLSRLGRRLTTADLADRFRRKLELAGSPPRWDTDRVLAVKMLGLVVGLALGVGVPALLGAGVLVVLGVALLAAALGFYTVDLWLYQKAYDRTERMRKELPDALDLLTISVEAGLTFDSALAQVALNTEGPLAEELFRVLQEMQIGVGRLEAIRALGDRSDLPELRGLVGAMVQADSFGVPVANVLRVQSQEMRIRRRQRGEETAQKIPVKILFPLIFCIMPALFIVVMGPPAVSIFHTFVHR